jgi:hypothetical protein
MKYYHQEKKNHAHKVVGAALILVIGFFTYDYFSFSAKNAAAQESMVTSTTNEDSAEPESPLSADQIALLSRIISIKLDGAILKDPVFLSFQDWEVKLGEEDAGRNNPFAPIPGSRSESQSQTRR